MLNVVYKLGVVSSSNVFTLCKFLAMLLFGFCVCATNHWLKIPGPQGPWVSIEIVVVKRSAAAVAPPLLS